MEALAAEARKIEAEMEEFSRRTAKEVAGLVMAISEIEDESDEERTDPTWTPHEEKNYPGDCDEEEEEQNDPEPSQAPNVYGFGVEKENETVSIWVAPRGPGTQTLSEKETTEVFDHIVV